MGCCSRSAVVLGGLARSAGIRASALPLRLLCTEDRGGGGSCCCSDECLRRGKCIVPGAALLCCSASMRSEVVLPGIARVQAWQAICDGARVQQGGEIRSSDPVHPVVQRQALLVMPGLW